MFDNLRDQANSASFYDDEAQFREAEESARPRPKRGVTTDGRFLGMTPPQRFFVAVMILIAICALGAMLLLIAGKVSLF